MCIFCFFWKKNAPLTAMPGMDMEVGTNNQIRLLTMLVMGLLITKIVGAHGGRSGHLMLFLVALSFYKLQTFLNNIPEGNPLKSVYLTPKIAFTFRPMWYLNGRVAYVSRSSFLQ